MIKLPPRRLTTAGLLSLLCLTAQVAPALCVTRPAPARGHGAAAQTHAALAESLPESDMMWVVDYKRAFDEAIPRLLADQRELRERTAKGFDDTAAITGLDLRAVGRVVTAVRTAEAAGGKDQSLRTSVSLVRGVDQEKWLAFARRKGPGAFKESRHGSKTLLTLRLTAEEKRTVEAVMVFHALGEEGLAFAALDADTLAYGTPAGVRAAVEARDGGGKQISAELVAAATRNTGAVLSAGGILPPSVKGALLPAGGKESENEFARMFSNVKLCSLAIELAPAGFSATLACGAGSPEQAKALGDVVTAVKTLSVFSQAKTSRDKAGVELLKSLAVSAEGDEVRVKSQVPEATVKALLMMSVSDVYLTSAGEHRQKGELDAALADFDKALSFNPENVTAYINRGNLHALKGDLDAAMADDAKAIALDPDNATAYNNRGLNRIRKGDYDAAVADLDKSIELAPGFAYAYNNRGHALTKLGRYEDALIDFNKSISLDPENATAFHDRGQLRYETGDYAAAVADFDKALALDAKMAEAYNGRGYARTALGEYEAAVADYEKALALDPKSADAYAGRGLAHHHQEKNEAAIADYEKAIALDPAPPSHLYSNRGFARANLGDFAGALADFNKAVAENPKSAVGHHGRGYVRYEQGEYAAAIADFDKAVAAEPEYAEAYCYRGLALLAQGKDAAAARDLKKCFELDGSLRDFFEELAKEVVETRRAKTRRSY